MMTKPFVHGRTEIDAALDNASKQAKKTGTDTKQAQGDVASLQRVMEAPFEHAEELQTLTARLEEIEAALAAEPEEEQGAVPVEKSLTAMLLGVLAAVRRHSIRRGG